MQGESRMVMLQPVKWVAVSCWRAYRLITCARTCYVSATERMYVAGLKPYQPYQYKVMSWDLYAPQLIMSKYPALHLRRATCHTAVLDILRDQLQRDLAERLSSGS